MRGRLALALALAAVVLPCMSADPAPLPKDPEGRVTFQEPFMVEGVSEPELYARAKAWIKAKSTPQAMMMTDLTDGQSQATVSFKDSFPALATSKGNQLTVYYILTIETRESRARSTFSGFTVATAKDPRQVPLEQYLETSASVPGADRLPQEITAKVLSIGADLKAGLNIPAPAAAAPVAKPG
jgi:hypothetical protein